MVNKIIVGLILGFTLVGNVQAQVRPVPPNTTTTDYEYAVELGAQYYACIDAGIPPRLCGDYFSNSNRVQLALIVLCYMHSEQRACERLE